MALLCSVLVTAGPMPDGICPACGSDRPRGQMYCNSCVQEVQEQEQQFTRKPAAQKFSTEKAA